MERDTLKPEEWGWKQSNGELLPVTMDLASAPEEQMKAIFCNCARDCSSLRCTCRKSGLNCSDACKNLHNRKLFKPSTCFG